MQLAPIRACRGAPPRTTQSYVRPAGNRTYVVAAQQNQSRKPLIDAKGAADGSASRRRLLVALPPCACAVCSQQPAAAAQQQERGNAFLERSFAAAMATGMADYESAIVPVKRQLFTQLLDDLAAQAAAAGSSGGSGNEAATAQLLELGVGTGPNLPYYADYFSGGIGGSSGSGIDGSSGGSSSSAASSLQLHITGLDRNPFMLPYLQDNLQRSRWPQERFSWVQGSAEQLPFEDGSMDAVVCTLVLCSVPDVPAVLSEVTRVLKPGGSLLFIEHTLAPQGRPLLRLGQRVLEPLQRLLADNCHLTRDPLPLIQAAGSGFQGGVTARRLSVEGASLIAPHVAGIARRTAA